MKKTFLVIVVLGLMFLFGGNAWASETSQLPVVSSPLAGFLQSLVTERGMSPGLVTMLLAFPVVSILVAFSRHVVGVNGLGVLEPALVAIVLLGMGRFGLVVLVTVLLSSILYRSLLKKVRLPFLPRISTMIWLVNATVFLVGAYILRVNFDVSMVLSTMLAVVLTEPFVEILVSRPLNTALAMMFETVLIGVIGALTIASGWLSSLVFRYPEVVLLMMLVANWLVGKYKGLRLLEIYRFRKMIKI